jgi:hypothetical protein
VSFRQRLFRAIHPGPGDCLRGVTGRCFTPTNAAGPDALPKGDLRVSQAGARCRNGGSSVPITLVVLPQQYGLQGISGP